MICRGPFQPFQLCDSVSRGCAGTGQQGSTLCLLGPLCDSALLRGGHQLLETPYPALQAVERSVDILLF